MNLTIFDSESKQKPTTNPTSRPPSSQSSQQHPSIPLPHKHTLQPNCTTSIFSTCVQPKQTDSSDMDEIEITGKKVNKNNQNCIPVQHKNKLQSSIRKKKLSLSKNNSKQSHQINTTPIKHKKQYIQSEPIIPNNKLYSEQRNKNSTQSHNKVQKINMCLAKSQPRKDYSETVTSLPNREEIKIPPNALLLNIKKEDDSARKTKLTLSNNFKSQIPQPKQIDQTISEFKPNITGQSIPQTAKSQSVMIQQSFMTARLKNIYGDTSRIQDLYNLSSNMAFYQTLTAGSRQLIASIKNSQNHSELEVQKYRSHDNSANYSSSSLHQHPILQHNVNNIIQYNQNQTDQLNNQYRIQPQQQERRRIGSFAKTIKTFNESDQRSQEESVVIQHIRNEGGFIACLPLNRGSIKEDSGDDTLQIYRRRYSSLAEDTGQAVPDLKDRFNRYAHQPIQQADNDEERQL